MIEGMSQGGLGANWGDGHATDASLMSRVPANANPNAFYKELVNAAYANNAIISTHVYGCASFSLSTLLLHELATPRAWMVHSVPPLTLPVVTAGELIPTHAVTD